eukprot:432820_1
MSKKKVRIKDRYKFDYNKDWLGSGKYGEVYKAIDKKNNNMLVAVKIIPKRKANLTEIDLMRSCDSPYVVKMLQTMETGMNRYIILEYCNGGSVGKQIKSKYYNEEEIKTLCKDVLKGLSHMHMRGICHRDVKPGNILIHEGSYKLGDLGSGKQTTDEILAQTKDVGSTAFMAPEIVRHDVVSYNQQVDIWSLGITLYRIAVRDYPYDHLDNPATVTMQIVEGKTDTSKLETGFTVDFRIFINEKCLVQDSTKRKTADQLLRDVWFGYNDEEKKNQTDIDNSMINLRDVWPFIPNNGEEKKDQIDNPLINLIDKQLQMYYKRLGRNEYDALFATWCDEQSFDDNGVAQELKADASESMVIDFTDDFPFETQVLNEKDKAQKILELLRKFSKGHAAFDGVIVSQEMFVISENDFEKTRELYKKQCPAIWNDGMTIDKGFLTVLSIGIKYKLIYLINLVDDYFRARVKHMDEHFSVNMWAENNKHIQKIRQFGVSSRSISKFPPHQLVIGAVASFTRRVCPQLSFLHFIKINDSIESVINYIVAAANLIRWLTKVIETVNGIHTRVICPFQFDLCLGFDQAWMGLRRQNTMYFDDEDDDDDDDVDDDDVDDDDDKKENLDNFIEENCIENISEKLLSNKLKHHCDKDMVSDHDGTFIHMMREFKVKIEKDKVNYPQRKRFIAFVDRRKQNDHEEDTKNEDVNWNKKEGDVIWMYEPPSDCRTIPKD